MNKETKITLKEEHLRQVSLQKMNILAEIPTMRLLESIDEFTSNDVEGIIVLAIILDVLEEAMYETVDKDTVLKIKQIIKEQGEEKKEDASN